MSFPKFMAALGLATMMSGAASAADLIEQPAPVIGGLYLRGDVGYVFKSHNSGDWNFYNQYPGYQGVDDRFDYRNFDLDDAASFGGGIGYRFNENFRVDATVDYFSPDFDGDTSCPSYVAATQFGQAAPDIECHYKDSADVDVWTAMANAYVDLPAFSIITPYIGAGIGAAYVDYGTLKSEECGFECGDEDNRVFKHGGEDDWRFASALMAGATFDVTQNVKIDAGYRYMHIQDGDAFKYDQAEKDVGAEGTQIRDDGFDLHTVRVGVRYEFN